MHYDLYHTFVEGKITRLNFFIGEVFQFFRKLFALTILRVEFGHFYSGQVSKALARGFSL
jgi:hypothetical protein